jgi:hypothetical protein
MAVLEGHWTLNPSDWQLQQAFFGREGEVLYKRVIKISQHGTQAPGFILKEGQTNVFLVSNQPVRLQILKTMMGFRKTSLGKSLGKWQFS